METLAAPSWRMMCRVDTFCDHTHTHTYTHTSHIHNHTHTSHTRTHTTHIHTYTHHTHTHTIHTHHTHTTNTQTHDQFLTHSNNRPSVAGCQKLTPSWLLWRSGAVPGATGTTNYLALTPPSRATATSAAHQNPSSFVQSLFRPDICTGRASIGIKGASMSHACIFALWLWRQFEMVVH